MIPYFPEPIFHAGWIAISAFSAAGAAAVALSGWTVLKRGCHKDIPADPMFRMWFWMVAGAGLGAVAPSAVFPDVSGFLLHPLQALHHHFGFTSLGAICGGFLGGLLWSLYHRLPRFEIFRRLEVLAYTQPLTAMTGRLGCALAHDHRGIATTSWIAVQFPEGPRFDLGLLEFLFLAGLAIVFRILDRKPRREGFFLFWLAVAYTGCRLWLDTLRVNPSYADVAVSAAFAMASGIAMFMLRPRAAEISSQPRATILQPARVNRREDSQ